MVSHSDYPFHGEYQLVYPDQLQDGDIFIPLERIEHSNDWLLQCAIDTDTNNDIFATLYYLGREHGPVIRTNCYLSFLNHKDKSKSEVFIGKFDSSHEFPCLEPILLGSEVLNEENGWLKDGKLTVEYGIHVESTKDDNLWIFNFREPTFQYEKTKQTIIFERKENKSVCRYCHTQLLVHHSSSIAKNASKNNWHLELDENFSIYSLENCLQIVHGTHIKFELIDYFKMLRIAHHYKLYNVIRYCEMELIKRKDEIKFIKNHIQCATHYKLNRYLASVLREMESPETIKEDFRHVDIDIMSGEMMKQCVMSLFNFF